MGTTIPAWVKAGAFMTTVECGVDSENIDETDEGVKVRKYRVIEVKKGKLSVEVRGEAEGAEETFTTSVEDWLPGVRMVLPRPVPPRLPLSYADMKLEFTPVGKDNFRMQDGTYRPCIHIRAPLRKDCSCKGSKSCPLCGGAGKEGPKRSVDVWVDDETGIMLKYGFYEEGELMAMVRLTATNILGSPPPAKKAAK